MPLKEHKTLSIIYIAFFIFAATRRLPLPLLGVTMQKFFRAPTFIFFADSWWLRELQLFLINASCQIYLVISTAPYSPCRRVQRAKSVALESPFEGASFGTLCRPFRGRWAERRAGEHFVCQEPSLGSRYSSNGFSDTYQAGSDKSID